MGVIIVQCQKLYFLPQLLTTSTLFCDQSSTKSSSIVHQAFEQMQTAAGTPSFSGTDVILSRMSTNITDMRLSARAYQTNTAFSFPSGDTAYYFLPFGAGKSPGSSTDNILVSSVLHKQRWKLVFSHQPFYMFLKQDHLFLTETPYIRDGCYSVRRTKQGRKNTCLMENYL